jgi:hypothetical protein
LGEEDAEEEDDGEGGSKLKDLIKKKKIRPWTMALFLPRTHSPTAGAAVFVLGAPPPLRPRPSPSAQGALKGEKSDAPTYLPTYLFLRFLSISGLGLESIFYGVFGLLVQRNGQKRDKNKIEGKRGQFFFPSSTFSAKSFF